MAKKAKTPDPLSEIAENLVAALDSHRSATADLKDSALLTWSQLVASQSGVSMDWALASLQKAPAKGQVVVAVPDDLKSPVALQKDLERLAKDPQVLLRLVQHPSTGCSESVPVRTVADLCKSLDKQLRKLTEAWWTQNPAALPSGLSPVLKQAGKKTIVSLHDERFTRPDVTLARKLVSSLESLRKAGESSYPALLSELLKKAEINADDPLLAAAFQQPPFSDSVMLVGGKLPAAWLALRSDVETAVTSEGFLRRLVHMSCSETSPEVKLSALAKLLSKELQGRFSEVWRTHFDLHRRFSFGEFSPAGSKAKPDLLIRDARYPRAEKLLSEQLVKILEGQKVIGDTAYPSTWKRLTELLKSEASADVLQKATTLEPFTGRVLLAFPAHPDSPVAFIDDAAELAGSARLLNVILSLMVSDENQAVTADKISSVKGLHPALKPLVGSAVEQSIESRKVPPGVGSLRIGRKWHMFRLSDLNASGSAAQPPEEPKPRTKKSASGQPASGQPVRSSSESKAEASLSENFAGHLQAAFEKLSSESRLPGCVSLADLRPSMPGFSREVFDAELIRLRREGLYSLSVVEGRYPLSDAEREACLVIDSVLHLLVRKRES